MTGRRWPSGGALFWICFILYAVVVALWLLVGLLPAVVHESGSLHAELHEGSEGALGADGTVSIQFENRDPDTNHNIRVSGPAGLIYAGPPTVGRSTEQYQFEAPEPGSYRIASDAATEVVGELRFIEDGAESITVRVDDGESRFVKAGVSSWAQRLADASHRADHGARVVLESLFSVLNLGLGLLLVVRRPRDRTARLLAVGMIGTAATFNHQAHVVLKEALLGDWWTPHLLFHLASGLAYMFAVILFPDGRLVPFARTPGHRIVLRLGYGLGALVIAWFVWDRSESAHPGQTFFTVLFGLAIPAVGVAAQTFRLSRAVDAERRQQSRLLRWALLPMLTLGLVYIVAIASFGGDTRSSIQEAGLAVFPALFALIPLALVMGILRYRLWEIDVLISRTLLSVGLVAFIGAVYVVVVVLIGHAVWPGGSGAFKIVATAIAAVAFEPVRERLERVANRLVYGQRATPYEVIAAFADRLSSVLSVDEVLPRTAEAVGIGVGAVACRVSTFLPGGGLRTVSWPDGDSRTSFTRVVLVAHAGRPVGEIAVAKRPGETLSAAEDGLLTSLAAQAGLAFNNARLTIELQNRLQEKLAQADDLRASRQRIVTARQGQRQRVVQIIHDRVETHLETADAELAQVEHLLPDDPDEAIRCFDTVLAEGQRSLDALRDLARGIFPAVLTDQGVMAALNAYLVQAQLPIDVDIEGWHDRFDLRAEASVYFCVVQALANAGTFAAGSHVTVGLAAREHRLEFSVTDDGPGTDQARLVHGADIQDMRDRVEAVGGAFEARSVLGAGTVVSGWVPAREPVGVGSSGPHGQRAPA